MIGPMNLDDHRHLEAARGCLLLGDWQSANDELEEIAPAVRAASEVLLVRVEIYLRAGKSDMAQPVAQTLARTRARTGGRITRWHRSRRGLAISKRRRRHWSGRSRWRMFAKRRSTTRCSKRCGGI